MAVLRVQLHAGGLQLNADDVASSNSKDPGFAIRDPVDGRSAGRAEVVGHRGPYCVPDTVYLQPVVRLGLAANLNRLVRGEIRSDLKDAARPFLAEGAVADCHHHRFALNGDLEPTTSALGSYCHALHRSTG